MRYKMKEIKKTTFDKPPQQFRKNSYTMTRIVSLGDVGLYKQTRGSTIYAYEVVRLKNIKGVGRVLPSNNDWGTHGWTFSTLAKSLEKLLELNRSKSEAL